jgi:hypothetical protein
LLTYSWTDNTCFTELLTNPREDNTSIRYLRFYYR